jgi:hypothetical protein
VTTQAASKILETKEIELVHQWLSGKRAYLVSIFKEAVLNKYLNIPGTRSK